jgi:tRNA threonylcarbamoyladenosine biosynthesis protein TsaE
MGGQVVTEIARYTTNSAEETVEVGRGLAAILPAKLILLRGDLGAGKTTLVKGIAQALGVASADDVTSPTFTLVHEYAGSDKSLYHLDLYRLELERELTPLGIEEMEENGVLLLVEWGEKFPTLHRHAWGEVHIEDAGEDVRHITVMQFS